jgi:hypothetical protein
MDAQMIIALDYDGTFTADPELWQHFIRDATERGHKVVCVTMRYPDEPIGDMDGVSEIIYTSREAKGPFMAALGRLMDVWIDDKPHWIFQRALA